MPALSDISIDNPVVLIVDDDDATRTLYARALSRAGIATVAARSGTEALAILDRDHVSLMLLDRNMPGLDGLEVIALARQHPVGAALPILLVTGAVGIDERVAGLQSGANDYITKPVALDELVARIRVRLREQEIMSAAIQHQRHRADAIANVARSSRGADDQAVLSAFCSVLLDHSGATSAFILAFDGPLQARVLSTVGRLAALLPAGTMIEPGMLSSPFERNRASSWVEPLPRRAIRGISHPEGSVIAFAPVFDGRAAVGLMAAVVESPTAGNRALAVVADTADTASAVMGDRIAALCRQAEGTYHIAAAIRDAEFVTHYQPIVDLVTGTTFGFEALTRWHSGVRPDVMFAEAWRLGLGLKAELVTAAAAIDAARALPNGTWLNLNFSAATITDGELSSILKAADRPVVLEITEHERIDDYHAIRSALERLGPSVRLGVDDAGSGYASLQHIVALAPAFLKVDMHFVRDIDTDPARQAMIAGLSHFCHHQGSHLIAEGIETTQERATLQALGIRLGQGYLLGRPAASSQFS